MPQPSASYEQAIVLELTQYQRSMMADERSNAKIYSYYADNDTKQRLQQLFGSITHPEVCPEHQYLKHSRKYAALFYKLAEIAPWTRSGQCGIVLGSNGFTPLTTRCCPLIL